jgi:hypothetical protein
MTGNCGSCQKENAECTSLMQQKQQARPTDCSRFITRCQPNDEDCMYCRQPGPKNCKYRK